MWMAHGVAVGLANSGQRQRVLHDWWFLVFVDVECRNCEVAFNEPFELFWSSSKQLFRESGALVMAGLLQPWSLLSLLLMAVHLVTWILSLFWP